jgi:hypothetical protein
MPTRSFLLFGVQEEGGGKGGMGGGGERGRTLCSHLECSEALEHLVHSVSHTPQHTPQHSLGPLHLPRIPGVRPQLREQRSSRAHCCRCCRHTAAAAAATAAAAAEETLDGDRTQDGGSVCSAADGQQGGKDTAREGQLLLLLQLQRVGGHQEAGHFCHQSVSLQKGEEEVREGKPWSILVTVGRS